MMKKKSTDTEKRKNQDKPNTLIIKIIQPILLITREPEKKPVTKMIIRQQGKHKLLIPNRSLTKVSLKKNNCR